MTYGAFMLVSYMSAVATALMTSLVSNEWVLHQAACDVVAGLFERAVGLDRSWEKGYFSYAVYLDQLMRDARQRQTALTASARGSAKPMDRLGGRSR